MIGTPKTQRHGLPGTRTPPQVSTPEADGDAAGSPFPNPRASEARAPLAAPAQPRSYAFAWQERVYAFGGTWFAFPNPNRRMIREALEHASATHWTRLLGDSTTHVGAFRLPDERGRILAAVEAARAHFGSDFIGAFELGCDSLSRAWWVVAVADGAVLFDSVFDDLQDAQAAYRGSFIPGREFGVHVAPRGFAPDAVREAALDEFLDLADSTLRRNAPRRMPSLVAAAAFLILGAAFAATQLTSGAGPAPAANREPFAPRYPQFEDPEVFGVACETAVAMALVTEADGWQLDSARCVAGNAQLDFGGGRNDAIRRTYPNASVSEAQRQASVSLPLQAPRRVLRAQDLDAATADDLARVLSVFGSVPRFERIGYGEDGAHFESYRFEFRTKAAMPVLLGAFSDIRNAEWTEVRFAPSELQWHVTGVIHVHAE